MTERLGDEFEPEELSDEMLAEVASGELHRVWVPTPLGDGRSVGAEGRWVLMTEDELRIVQEHKDTDDEDAE